MIAEHVLSFAVAIVIMVLSPIYKRRYERRAADWERGLSGAAHAAAGLIVPVVLAVLAIPADLADLALIAAFVVFGAGLLAHGAAMIHEALDGSQSAVALLDRQLE